MSVPDLNSEQPRQRGLFVTTCWDTVRRAVDTGSEEVGREALETLCSAYWYPLYAYVRRLGQSPEDAQDVVQSFFVHVLRRSLVADADPEQGQFRSFLLGALKHFMANQWRRETAQKRGGGQLPISFDASDAEGRYLLEPTEMRDPSILYEQAWARAVLEESMSRLEREFERSGKRELFEALAVFLQGDRGLDGYAQIGNRLGMTEGAVKVAVLRLRRRYRELLRSVVADTVVDPMEVDSELQRLQSVLRA